MFVDIVGKISSILSIIFGILFSYRILVGIIGCFGRKKYKPAKEDHTYCILIAGRNEEKVVGQLIDSILEQNYPMDKIKIFAVADNCTDGTANVVREHNKIGNVYCYERFNKKQIGKGYALNFLLQNIQKDFPDYSPEAFMIFDADNLLDKNYIMEMNKVFDSGEKIVTSYRNSKNFHSNWVTATSGMGFMRECRFVHNGRNCLGTSTTVSGTGFLFDANIIKGQEGYSWNYKTLVEDIEFSTDNVTKGNRVAYCDDAIFYDEQPATFKASWNQRMRWQKGFFQVFALYFKNIFSAIFSRKEKGKDRLKKAFSCYDISLFIFPYTMVMFFWNVFAAIYYLCLGLEKFSPIYYMSPFADFVMSWIVSIGTAFVLLFIYGMLVLIREHKRVKTSFWQKIKYSYMFPIFIMSYIPIAIVCFFKGNVQWKQIPHEDSKSIKDLENAKALQSK